MGGRGFGNVQEKKEAPVKDGKKGKKVERKTKQSSQQKPTPQEQRSIEERFLTKSEAMARGEDEPAVAFQKRLEALKRDSRAKLKERQSSFGEGGGSAAPLSILDASPNFSAPPASTSGASSRPQEPLRTQYDSRRSEEVNEGAGGFGPGQFILGAGALILAAIFALTSFTDLGGGPPRSQSTQQERKLGDQEKKDLEKEVAELEAQLAGGSADSATLRRAAGAYAALGDAAKAGATLERLTDKEPSDVAAWQALGEVRSGAGDSKGAVAAYKRAAAEAAEPDLGLLQGLAEALVSDGRPKEAAEYLLEQRKLAEAGRGVDTVSLELLLGRVYSEWDRHDAEAMAVYDSLIDKYPSDFRGYLAKGVLLRKEGRKGDMQRAFLQARYNARPEATPILDRVIGNTNGRL
ncbi:g6892 [Coccomyxa elongata]